MDEEPRLEEPLEEMAVGHLDPEKTALLVQRLMEKRETSESPTDTTPPKG